MRPARNHASPQPALDAGKATRRLNMANLEQLKQKYSQVIAINYSFA